MNKQQLQNEIEIYIRYYYTIKKEFDLYKFIKQNSEIYKKETAQISFFLQPILYSLLNSVLLDTCQLVDSRNDKYLENLLNICIQNLKEILVNPNSKKEKDEKLKIINEKKNILESKQQIIFNLKAYRDKSLAHRDKEYFEDSNKVFEDYNTTYEEMENLLSVIQGILNELLYMTCNTSYCFTEEYKTDYKYILECIKYYNQKNTYHTISPF